MNPFAIWSAILVAPFVAAFAALIVVETGVALLRLSARGADLDASGDVL